MHTDSGAVIRKHCLVKCFHNLFFITYVVRRIRSATFPGNAAFDLGVGTQHRAPASDSPNWLCDAASQYLQQHWPFFRCNFLHHSTLALSSSELPVSRVWIQTASLCAVTQQSWTRVPWVQAVGSAGPWLDKPVARPSPSQGGQNTSMARFWDATTLASLLG